MAIRRMRVGLVTSALACMLALGPGRAEAGYRYAGQWAVPTAAQAIAVGPSGVYVSNRQSTRAAAKVTRYSPAGRLTATWGDFGAPGGLSVGPDGRIWVVEGLGTIRVFAPGGAKVDEQTVVDSCGDGRPVLINDVDVDAKGDLYVTVYDNCDLGGAGARRAVVRTSFPGWRVAGAWGGLDGSANDGEFGVFPLSVASNGRGNVYVTDEGNQRVQQFTSAGGFVRKWGQLGSRPGQFNGLRGIAIGPSGDIFVADRNNDRIQRLAPDGSFREQFSVPKNVKYSGLPLDLDVDSDGRIYMLSTKFATEDEVNVFAPSGNVRLPTQNLRYREGNIRLRLACSDAGACEGTVRIRKGERQLAKGRYALAAGRHGTTIARPTTTGVALLKSIRSAKVTVELRPVGGGAVKKQLTLRG